MYNDKEGITMASKVILDKIKYKAAFIYMLEKLGKIEGKKKAYKLFYFLDFDFYEAYEKSFTGETYRALQMGPAPVYFDVVIQEMEEEGMIETERKRMALYHENDTLIYKPKKSVKYKFTLEEKKMLDRIINLYGNSTGKDLENISHSQAPYAAVGQNDIIPYEFSFYRDTPNLT